MAFLHEKGCYLQGRRDVFSGANAHCISHLSVFTVWLLILFKGQTEIEIWSEKKKNAQTLIRSKK